MGSGNVSRVGRLGSVRFGVGVMAALLAASAGVSPAAAEPASCLSPDPAQWPSSSKPYFMIIVDTSGSMTTGVATSNSCGYPNDRMGHARCAVKNTVQAFSEVNFGLAGYAWRTGCLDNPPVGCYTDCYAYTPTGDDNACGPFGTDSGLGGTSSKTIHRGAQVFVPLLQDHYWSQPPSATNVPDILSYVDDRCGTTNSELAAYSNTPLGGSLFSMYQYFSGQFVDPFTSATLASPIGTQVQGERACRSINVILITDGDETCDYSGGGFDMNPTPIAGGCRSGQTSYLNNNLEALASFQADRLFTNGVTIGGQNFKIKTHVIGFAGATVTALDHIATCGGTTSSYSTANETQLSAALANIVAGAIKPETCDNGDNNCNGCTDEGFTHYCDVGQTCCAWATAAQRTTCLQNYKSSITPQTPNGDTTKLPCTTAAQQTDPASWLCYDPKEKCDNVDNNCQAGVDEGVNKCGNPLHCPSAEVCNGVDDNCDGQVDEGVCNGCVPSPEVCDGCDNDCDGIADNGSLPTIPCGQATPANCAGQLACKPPQAVGFPGACAPSGGYGACTNNPQAEVCDGVDNNCNGIIDDGIAPTACVPAGTPAGLNYGPNSQCKQGTKACGGQCVGFVGPSTEICDGIDNDCDGVVDDGVIGVGQPCGVNQAPCTPGTTACVNGALVCQGGNGPQPEVCDGIDNNCNGQADEAPLADAPPGNQNGCWTDPGNCCTFQNLAWCPPAGATCNGNGTLTSPCNKGTLVCAGAAHWVCQGPKGPAPETCDGVDNNCNGGVDDGNLPGVGAVCGSDTGECKAGVTTCVGGVLDCAGDVPPSPEACDGLDNDCDGTIDNGIVVGGPCSAAYDPVAYPGDRTLGACKPGISQCDGNGGQTCAGGVGPQPEVCDGIDNDCDGQVDEVGAAPDGIDGSANPLPPPAGNIGDACGVDEGVCKGGKYACVNGQFSCIGGQGPQPEQCDCLDNDCNGSVDDPGNGPALCSAGKNCVASSFGCQCAAKCGGEFGCPGGQVCQEVTDSNTGKSLGKYCVADACGDCASKTVKDGNGNVVCAPAGTELANCVTPPVCTCKGQNGCKDPCYGVTCQAGTVCAEFGPNAGQCVVDNCFNNPCQGCGKVCNLGSCVDNPCHDDSCQPDEECKPSADFTSFTCVKSCADVTCNAGETCVGGACVASCDPACANGQACDLSQTPPACVQSKCDPNPCTDGSFCDPVTGQCGNDPCEGVLCPQDQTCSKGDCHQGGAGGGTSTSSTSTGSGGTTASTGSSTGTGAGASGAGGDETKGVWGLATGGGGCACEAGGSSESNGASRWLLVGLAVAIGGMRRRRRRTEAAAGSEEVSR
jgi:hypothetical protein